MRMVSIVKRVARINSAGKRIIVRLLDCDHEQVELSGGKSKYAQIAKCKTCTSTRRR